MLKLNKERQKLLYKQSSPDLPEDLVDKFITRSRILGYNPLFVAEWSALNTLAKSKGHTREEYDDACNVFGKRWHVSYPEGLIVNLKSLYVRQMGDDELGKLKIEIDLNGSKEKILAEVEHLISFIQKEFREKISKYPDFKPDEEKNKAMRLPGNVKNDLEDYDLIMEVYAAKEDGNSWSQIVDHFKLNNIDTARNHYNSAKKLIKSGLPGFPPFPQK